jgi:hypothetical protein
VALIFIGVSIVIDVRKNQTSAIWKAPHLVANVPDGTEQSINLLGTLDQFSELRQFPANYQPNCVRSELIGMASEIT